MTKGKAQKVTNPAHKSLNQARLIGLNDHVRSVRQKPSISHGGLKQVDLASLGFGNVSKKMVAGGLLETPSRKCRKHLSPDVEVPETQFAQNTQSPELNYHDALDDMGMEYSSPLSSPPPEEEEEEEERGGGGEPQASVSSIITMPPPPVPVTPKRRRVLEVPDSKSPPTTPFTPYQSQQERCRLNSQASPTARLNKSPMVLQVGEDIGEDVDEYHNPTLKRAGRTLFAPSPKRLREKKDDKAKCQGTNKSQGWKMPVEVEEVGEDIATGSRDRTIDSSQWWDLEDTQDALLSTQNTPTQRISIVSQAQNIATASVPLESQGLSYKSDRPFGGPSNDDSSESQGASHMGDHKDSQQSPRSMTYPMPPKPRDDTPKPEPELEKLEGGEHPVLPIGENKAVPILEGEEGHACEDTASEEEYPEPRGKSEEIPEYDAYRTQQFPSSFWQHGGAYRHGSPGLLVSSQWDPGAVCGEDLAEGGEMQPSQCITPDIVDESSSTGKEGEWERVPSQWIAPEIVNETEPVGQEDGREPSQFLPGTAHPATEDTEARSQPLPGEVIPATALLATVHEEDDMENVLSPLPSPKPDPEVAGEKDDGDQNQKIFKYYSCEDDYTESITTSQLLPSELMETFPMPPPLSQYSSYDYGYDDLNIESETQ